jgi:hypothetical protein
MIKSHVRLKFIFATKGFLAFTNRTFELLWSDVSGLDVSPETRLSGKCAGIHAPLPSALVSTIVVDTE